MGLEDDVAGMKADRARMARWEEEFRRIGVYGSGLKVFSPTGVVADAVAELIPLVPRNLWESVQVVRGPDGNDYVREIHSRGERNEIYPSGIQRAFVVIAKNRNTESRISHHVVGLVLSDGRLASKSEYKVYFDQDIQRTFREALGTFADRRATLVNQYRKNTQDQLALKIGCAIAVAAGVVGLILLFRLLGS